MHKHYNRRAADIESDKLTAMLEGEDDASKRSLLLVLSSLNANLIANTAATDSIRKDLTSHLNSYQEHMVATAEFINKGKGAWKVVAWVLSIAQMLLIASVTLLANNAGSIATTLTSLQVTAVSNSHRITSVERQLK